MFIFQYSFGYWFIDRDVRYSDCIKLKIAGTSSAFSAVYTAKPVKAVAMFATRIYYTGVLRLTLNTSPKTTPPP